MSKIMLHNSLTRQKEEFVPLDAQNVRMYACGPTVYNYAHIGNARMAVVFDLWARVLRSAFPKVTYASNITDVEDKIIAASKETGEEISSITEKYTRIYNEDMAGLGVLPPDIQPKATEHIQEMIDQIAVLVERGHAYAEQGHVLFHVPSDPSYGALSGRSRDDQIAGARVEVAPYKKDPADFVLWKPSSDDQPGWDSPWGFGRPGWHIECSAMSEKHLGLPFDIHGGGADLKFPHHENEIAQSCCANGQEENPENFAKYWVHNGFVTVEGEKMAKSVGNVILAHDLVAEYPGEVLRLTLLSAHYRQPLDWTESLIQQNKKLLDKLYKALAEIPDLNTARNDKNYSVPNSIYEALYDDLNTPKAIAAINSVLKTETDPKKLTASLLAIGDLLGILQQDPQDWLGLSGTKEVDEGRVQALLQEREEARKQKDFARSDAIRDELLTMDIIIEDTANGPTWRLKK